MTERIMIRTKRLRLRLISLAVVTTLLISLLPNALVAEASSLYSSEMSFINDNSVRPTFWIAPNYWTLLSRQQIADNLWRVQPPGVDYNFVWYAPEAVIQVGNYHSTQWSYRNKWGGVSWIALGNLFYDYVNLHVLTYAGTFIGLACGNRTRNIINPPPPKISGWKFNDINENGVWDSGEPALSGWEIGLYRDGIYRGSTRTDTNGYYEFSIDANWGLTPGWYTLNENLKPGWVNTRVPGAVYVQEGNPGVNYGGNNFGNFKLGKISGYKRNDANGDGQWSDTDASLPNWPIKIAKGTEAPKIVTTNSNGYYEVEGLHYGDYTIWEDATEADPRGEWKQTWPSNGSKYTVHIESGTEATNNNFANVLTGEIEPIKVNDTNINGRFDPGEEILSWTMHLHQDLLKDVRPPIVTPGTWDYLIPGVYQVEEEMGDNWAPTDGQIVKNVDLGQGQKKQVQFFNVQTGDIIVPKFHDLNRNGLQDAGEPPVPEWTIFLKKTDGSLVVQDALGNPIVNPAKTDSNGFAYFKNLFSGEYFVEEETRPYWAPTTVTARDVRLQPGETVTVPFGNINVGNIVGIKFHDYDLDGQQDQGEPGVPGVVIKLDGKETTKTEANGTYRFNDVSPGPHVVSEEVPAGWKPTTPTEYTIQVVAGTENVALPFGNVQVGSISGFKFDDTDADGTWDQGGATPEKPLAGWVMKLSGTLVNGVPFGPITTTTESDGSFRFSELKPGSYMLEEVGYYVGPEIRQDGWRNTTAPTSPITITPGLDVANQLFGNIKLGSISGFKFDDWNTNGIWDEGEPQLEGWAITLEGIAVNGEKVGPVAVKTDVNGYYEFKDLLPGDYRLTEEQRDLITNPDGSVVEPGWFNTLAPPQPMPENPYPIHLNEGESTTDRSFGNKQYGWIQGRVYNAISGAGIGGVRIDLLEIQAATTTNESGYYYFYKLIPSGTTMFPSPTYTVEIALPPNYWAPEVTKFVKVENGKGTQVDWPLWSPREDNPRTIGYWKNWDNHYTREQMEVMIAWVKVASGLFPDLTVDNLKTYLTITKYSTMQDKAQAQLIGTWLNIASRKLAMGDIVDLSPIANWSQVITAPSGSSQITVYDLIQQIDEYFKNNTLTSALWEIVKNILDALNNGLLFPSGG